jgi:uncharacterized protein (DUF433 family)
MNTHGDVVMNLPEFLTRSAPDDIRLTGHRIGLEQIVALHRKGLDAPAIHDYYPTLPFALVQKVIAFYLENKAGVDAYVADCEAEIDRQRATAPQGPTLADLQRRLTPERHAERT